MLDKTEQSVAISAINGNRKGWEEPFQLKQGGVSAIPGHLLKGYEVAYLAPEVLLVKEPDGGWVLINLHQRTFSVGTGG